MHKEMSHDRMLKTEAQLEAGIAALLRKAGLIQGHLKICHRSAGAAMLVPVLSGLRPSFGQPRYHC